MLAAHEGPTGHYVLMDHVDGVEVGVGAYFNGKNFMTPAFLDWEHKRFFAGDMGELTGEMGTIATFSGSQSFFDRTLAPLATALRDHCHIGWVNLNTIVNADGIWPLELTCRFGYPGFAVLEPLQADGWGTLFAQLIDGSATDLKTHDGFSVGVVLTTPPFPYSREEVTAPVGLPVVLPTDRDDRHFHFGEVGLNGTQLVTSGLYGWTMVVTGTAATIELARDEAYRRARQVIVPNVRYRLDIGDKLIAGELARLTGWGVFEPKLMSRRMASQMVR
jgi:phosphoribosylamine--glycine ligase